MPERKSQTARRSSVLDDLAVPILVRPLDYYVGALHLILNDDFSDSELPPVVIDEEINILTMLSSVYGVPMPARTPDDKGELRPWDVQALKDCKAKVLVALKDDLYMSHNDRWHTHMINQLRRLKSAQAEGEIIDLPKAFDVKEADGG